MAISFEFLLPCKFSHAAGGTPHYNRIKKYRKKLTHTTENVKQDGFENKLPVHESVFNSLTYYTLCIGVVLESCKTKIPDLNQTGRSSNKYVIALKIAVNDWGRSAVKEMQTLQNLATPVFDDFNVDLLETSFDIPGQKDSKSTMYTDLTIVFSCLLCYFVLCKIQIQTENQNLQI